MNIVKSNGQYSFYNKIEIIKQLEVKNYLLKHSELRGVWLEDAEDFSFPEKIYDIDTVFRDIVRKSFRSHDTSTGVLLGGYKGQGKTVTAKLLCKELNLPVVLIDSSIPKEIDFITFLNEIKQSYILFIDEFEKSFPEYQNEDKETIHLQESFLSLMDGAITTSHKKLYLFTSNSEVNDKFLNRPSRIRFYKNYQYMDKEMYNMIIEDLLENPSFKEDLLIHLPIQEATTDLLISIIKEINIHKIPYSEFKSIYNHQSRRIKYNLFYKSKSTWIELGVIYLNSDPPRDNGYINNMYAKEIISIDEDVVVFTSDNISDKFSKKDKEKFKGMEDLEFTYKLEKVPVFEYKTNAVL